MDKRKRPAAGYFSELERCELPKFKKRSVTTREVLDGPFFVDKLLAKKRKGHEVQFLVKWQMWSICDSTWEPAMHIPKPIIQEFERPSPSAERIEDAIERLAYLLERGLKKGLQYTETLEIKHEVVRSIFPRMPSEISRRSYQATEKEFRDAGLGDNLERTVTVTGARRRIEFPVSLRLVLGLSPKFEEWKSRHVQRLKVSFFKEHI